jgi:hypothetical protein
MLLWCPACGRAFPSGALKPEAGTAACAEHGEVRPHVGHPKTDEEAGRARGWSTTWSRRGASYAYEARIHDALRASFAPFPSHGWTWASDPLENVLGVVVGAALAVPLLAARYSTRLLGSPRVQINARRVRFGLRSLSVDEIGAFAATKDGRGSQLVAVAEHFVADVVLLDCSRGVEALVPLRDELNEALFVVRRQAPLLSAETPYRG